MLKRSNPDLMCGCDYVVLFTAPSRGIVVHVTNDCGHKEVAIGWDGTEADKPGFGEQHFKPFNDTVQLSNQ